MLAAFDEYLFIRVFNLSQNLPWLEELMVSITNLSAPVFFLIYLAGFIFLILKRSRKIIPYLLAPALALLAVQVIRYYYLRPRPFVALEIESLIEHAANGSLPSRHAVSAFAIALSILAINKKAGRLVLLLAFVTGLSRVMVGVHYPLDIITGALLAAVISFSIFSYFYKLSST